MTQLRRQMLEEFERRNYSANTVRTYIRTVEELARYFKRRPDRLRPEHIRQYQAHLFRDRKLAANSVAQRVAALRFFLHQDTAAKSCCLCAICTSSSHCRESSRSSPCRTKNCSTRC